MKIIFFLIFAILEYFIILVLTNKLNKIKEYVSINYTSFEFSDINKKPCGLNILIEILFPIFFMVIISGILYKKRMDILVYNIYETTIFYFIIRWLIIILFGKKDLVNWKHEFTIACTSVSISIILYYVFIIKTKEIFISINELRDAIWIAIITFMFVIIRDAIYNYAYVNEEKLNQRKKNYILKKYEKFVDKYDDIVRTKNKELHNIVYSIMIYEDYNRPKIKRIIEPIKLAFKGKATLGIMQVESRTIINDRTSVKRGYRIIKNNYFKNKRMYGNNNKLIISDTIAEYNYGQQYLNEVLYIKNIIENI